MAPHSPVVERTATLEAAEIVNVSNVSNASNSSDDGNATVITDEEQEAQSRRDVEDARAAKDVSNMDKHSVRLRWRSFDDQCLIVYGDLDAPHNETGFTFTVWKCHPTKEAWFRQRYLLPPPDTEGQIKSQIGKVTGDGTEDYCLVVPSCIIGTPVEFRPCADPNIHNTFIISEHSDGTVRIKSPKCPADHCVDVPDQNMTTGNAAQIWECPKGGKTNTLLDTDEIFSVGISANDMKVFDSYELTAPGAPKVCQPLAVPNALGKGLDLFEVRCPVADEGSVDLLFGQKQSSKDKDEELGLYAHLWTLWCSGAECECKAHTPTENMVSIPRTVRSLECGVIMLSTHPEDGACPRDLKSLRTKVLKGGEVDCTEAKKLTTALQNHRHTAHRIDLRFVQAYLVGLLPGDAKAFQTVSVRNSSGLCNASNTTSDEEAKAGLQVFEMKCPADHEGASLGIEVTKAEGEDISKDASVWSLWCMHDQCVCEPTTYGEELFAARLSQGDEGCGAVMLNTHSKYGSCPKDLKELQDAIEDDEEIDCGAGKDKAMEMSADPVNAQRLKLKWVVMSRDESAITKVTKQALNIFSIIGGAVVIGTVPAWPAVAKFAQFLVMMASNHAELGLPDEFNSFAHKFTKFDELVKPLKKIKLPGLKDLGIQVHFMASSKWFLLKDKFVNQTMYMVLRVFKESGMISPGFACFLSQYYDPSRRNLRNVSEVLESNGGKDPCDYSVEEEAGVFESGDGRRLAEDAAEDESMLVSADGGMEAVNIRKKWAQFKAAFKKQLEFLQKTLSYSKKEFSVTKNLLFCLLALPAVILIYCVVYVVLWLTKSKYSYIPFLSPAFLLIFMADLVLLNVLMAWANVVWRRRLLQCENPFIMLDQFIRGWDGVNVDEPITSLAMGFLSCFRPIISVLALIPSLHVNLANSQHIAMAIFILGPVLIFIVWFLHFLCSKIGRHPEANHHVDEECAYIKGTQPVMGLFKKQLFYEPTEVNPVSMVVATNADCKAIYKDGKLQSDVEATSKCSQLTSLCSGMCASNKDKKKDEGKQVTIQQDEAVAKTMSDANTKFDWAFRVKDLDNGFRGLPEEVTLTFETTLKLQDMGHAAKPHVRLRLARGHQIVSVAFQARSRDPKSPFPEVVHLEPKASKEERHRANKMAMARDLLQSTWRRQLVERIKAVIAKKAELGYLRWTMWDSKEGWTIAAFNLEVIRPPSMQEQEYVQLGQTIQQLVENFMKSGGEQLLQAGWREARQLVKPHMENYESCWGTVQESRLWKTIAEDSAKARLTAAEVAQAFPEVDTSGAYVAEEHKPDKKEGEEEEEAGVTGGSVGIKTGGENQKVADAGPTEDSKVKHDFDDEAEGFMTNLAVAASFSDEHIQQVKEIEPTEENEKLALTLTCPLLKSARRGDVLQIWIAGEKEEESGSSGTDPLVEKSWKKALADTKSCHLLAPEIKPWEDPRNHFEQVAVIRKKQERSDQWMEVLRKFPEAFVGKVQVPVKLQEGFGANLSVRVGARDLLRLDDEVPLTVPFSHLQLQERDRWRVFYLNDQQKKKGESPHLIKIINGLNLLFMVFAVVLIPKSIKKDAALKAQEDKIWASACPKGMPEGVSCNPNAAEFQEMTEQADRQSTIVEGLSAAMIALGGILLIKVLINAYQDGDLKAGCGCCTSLKNFIMTEWAYLKKIFKREKRESITIQDINYVKVTGDIMLKETFSSALKKSVKGAQPEEITLEMMPGTSKAIVYAQVPKDFPRDKEVNVSLAGAASITGNEEKFDVTLKVAEGKADRMEFEGCRPPSEEDGVSRVLGNYGGDQSAGWFASLKEAAQIAKSTVEQTLGLKAKKDKDAIYVFDVSGATLDDLDDGGHESALKEALKEQCGMEVKAVELTCNSIQVVFTFPSGYNLDLKKVEANLEKEDKDLKKVKTSYKPSVGITVEATGGRCPSWFTLGFVIGLLKFILIVFIGLLSLANGSGFLKAGIAILVSLFLWMISRLIFDAVVEGSIFRSSTLEIGQVALIILPVLKQTGYIEPITCSILMIIGVLWALVTLCCKFLKDTVKKYEQAISKFIKTHTATLKKYSKKYTNLRDLSWFYELVEKVKMYRLRISHTMSIVMHNLAAKTRDPAFLWGIFFGICFLICVILIAKLQNMALEGVSHHLTGSTDTNRQVFLHEIPALLGIFLLCLVLLALAYMVFMSWLPNCLQKRRDKELLKEHEELTKEATKVLWTKDTVAEQDKDLQDRVMKSLTERARAFPKKEQPVSEGQEGNYAALTVEASKRRSVLLDPLGIPVPMSAVPIFADDGASILEGDLRLQNGNVAMKRLLCTEWAWSSPRYLVERTPLQVNIEFFKKANDGSALLPGDEKIPEVGLTVAKGKPSFEVLVCTLQVVNFVGLTLGSTDRNDGVLSLFKSPDLDPADQLAIWFQQVRRFFADYGASYDKGSRVYGVLESLFWGIKDWGAPDGPPVGLHVEEHKREHMVNNEGKPYIPWVYRNMDDLVRRIGPNRPKPGAEELEEVSDDEQQHLDAEEKKKKGENPGEGTPSTASGGAPGAKAAAAAAKKSDKTKGTLCLVIRQAKNLPNEGGEQPYVQCVVKTPSQQEGQTAPASELIDPQFEFQQLFNDFEPGKNEVTFTIRSSASQLATGKIMMRMNDLKGGAWWEKELDLAIDPALNKGKQTGCCAPCGCGTVEEMGKPKLSIRACWTVEEDSDTAAAAAPEKVKGKRSPAAQGFCGGPLTWQLLYPPAQPQLLHVAVAAEDLRCCPERSKAVVFGAPPVLGQRGAEPLLRETRVMGREPGRPQDDKEDIPRPASEVRSPRPNTSTGSSSPPPDMSKATKALDTSKKDKLKAVVARGNVSVDEKKSLIVFRKAIDFEPRVRAREGPTAEYLNASAALAIVKDAAAVLDVYSTAKVSIEGHTSTKDADLDDYAHSLARNRAEKVMQSLVAEGVDASRLTAAGKPGKNGTGKKEVLLKVTSI